MAQPRKREGVMLCYDYDERRLLRWPTPWLVQPKLEGDRCRAVRHNDEWILYSSTGLVRTSVPHINSCLNERLASTNYLELDGELYTHGMPHEMIRSIVSRTINLHEAYHTIQYHIFDIIDERPQINRREDLHNLWWKIFKDGDAVEVVPTALCSDLEAVHRAYEHFLNQGYEGIIVRNPQGRYKRSRSTDVMKLKPRNELTAVVVGMVEEKTIDGTPKQRMGALVCRHPEVTNDFEVGTGFTHEERLRFWEHPEEIIGQLVEVYYQSFTAESVKMTSFKRIVEHYD